jgi:L-alanine-DL-glutamate epimerase-like enolase superfamily enzyme
MKIVAIREKTFPIASPIRNAVIDGRPVVGYGFNSNGRYGQGALLRERFIPRVLEADPRTLVDETAENLDPRRIWDCAMRNEKPGGHGERSVAVGTLDMAVWDAVAKMARKPLYRSPRRCIPHGGHQMSLNIAAGLGLGGNESYPDLFQPFGGFPDGVRVENGRVRMHDSPGIGFEEKSDLFRVLRPIGEG